MSHSPIFNDNPLQLTTTWNLYIHPVVKERNSQGTSKYERTLNFSTFHSQLSYPRIFSKIVLPGSI